ncbi:hypothetical protein PHYSODRAFT_333520 [Phytophthora sojae]|uniref:Uncharacterized protein n=1 Tax=Phytophthora sojae (strain P6497) TaxID=1094619 RepID=G4ZL31_PHYSP|nr:hypothetical protein PHYSODRAFT_333520 [Phytophthora sojae]EGZ15253.1 hypothetical protein PHYSODRAFT_333520 [Phytophthora sojae]|eukprot:XP_009529002.1 hypothetical protein PHYSODRAFT_333520 [Phytophthora sojae]
MTNQVRHQPSRQSKQPIKPTKSPKKHQSLRRHRHQCRPYTPSLRADLAPAASVPKYFEQSERSQQPSWNSPSTSRPVGPRIHPDRAGQAALAPAAQVACHCVEVPDRHDQAQQNNVSRLAPDSSQHSIGTRHVQDHLGGCLAPNLCETHYEACLR